MIGRPMTLSATNSSRVLPRQNAPMHPDLLAADETIQNDLHLHEAGHRVLSLAHRTAARGGKERF
jgi:hypothetical protein